MSMKELAPSTDDAGEVDEDDIEAEIQRELDALSIEEPTLEDNGEYAVEDANETVQHGEELVSNRCLQTVHIIHSFILKSKISDSILVKLYRENFILSTLKNWFWVLYIEMLKPVNTNLHKNQYNNLQQTSMFIIVYVGSSWLYTYITVVSVFLNTQGELPESMLKYFEKMQHYTEKLEEDLTECDTLLRYNELGKLKRRQNGKTHSFIIVK